MYLGFFVARLKVQGKSKDIEVYLRFKSQYGAGAEEVSFKEKVLSAFCFPLGADAVQPKEVLASEDYTFLLTHGDGQRYYGFCRQILPPAPRMGSRLRYPQVLCIISQYPWCTLFFKVLQVAEQVLKGPEHMLDGGSAELPAESLLGMLLSELATQLGTDPAPGDVLKLTVPRSAPGLLGVSPPRFMFFGSSGDSLNWTDDKIELQVPPDCGNGRSNSGIALARLLWHVPPEAMLTLVASMLLERRIVFVSQSRDTVSAAVQAAQALLYPFKWHHILLPILPRGLMDYLSAPMPFMVGLPADMMMHLRGIPMNEITMIDLDLKTCEPVPGSARDDGRLLPFREQLAAGFGALAKTLRSPTEYESSPMITGLMQEYFVRLFGSYRRYIHEDISITNSSGSFHRLSSSGGPAQPPLTAHGRSMSQAALPERPAQGQTRGMPQASSSGRLHDEFIRGHGHYFDQPAFVVHKRHEKVRLFLQHMRGSQLYQVFIQERLEMASKSYELEEDAFETRVSTYPERRRARRERLRALAALAQQQMDERAHAGMGGGGQPAGGGAGSRLAGKLRRHRRTDSEDMQAVNASAMSAASGMSMAMMSKVDSMRRIVTAPLLSEECTPSAADPSSFFWMLDDEEDLDISSPMTGFRGTRSASSSSLDAQQPEAPSPSHHSQLFKQHAHAPPAPKQQHAPHPPQQQHQQRGAPDEKPLGRSSAPLLVRAAAAADRMFSHQHSNSQQSNTGAGFDGAQEAAAAGDLVVEASVQSNAMYNMCRQGSGSAQVDECMASLEIKDGVQVRTTADGHRMYEGRMKDMIHMMVTDVKSVFTNFKSPRNSPREPGDGPPTPNSGQLPLPAMPYDAAAAGGHARAAVKPASPLAIKSPPQVQSRLQPQHPAMVITGTVAAAEPDPGSRAAHQVSAGSAASTIAAGAGGGGGPFGGLTGQISGIYANLKDKVGGAHRVQLTPSYKPQNTGGSYKPQTTGGEKSAKFREQLIKGSITSLLDGSNGKLKQPLAPQRPLSMVVPHMNAANAAGHSHPYAPSADAGATGTTAMLSQSSQGMVKSTSLTSLVDMPSMVSLQGKRSSAGEGSRTATGAEAAAFAADWDPFEIGPPVRSVTTAGPGNASPSVAAAELAAGRPAGTTRKVTWHNAPDTCSAAGDSSTPHIGGSSAGGAADFMDADFAAFAGPSSPRGFTSMFGNTSLLGA